VSIGNLDFNTKDKCAVTNCKAQGYAVAASMGGAECYCGDKYPPKAALVDDSNCNTKCPGFGWQACEYFHLKFDVVSPFSSYGQD
jgi:cell wall integrity and stress response component